MVCLQRCGGPIANGGGGVGKDRHPLFGMRHSAWPAPRGTLEHSLNRWNSTRMCRWKSPNCANPAVPGARDRKPHSNHRASLQQDNSVLKL